MRSLHVLLGVGALSTLLAAGWLGQKVLGQPELPGLPSPPGTIYKRWACRKKSQWYRSFLAAWMGELPIPVPPGPCRHRVGSGAAARRHAAESVDVAIAFDNESGIAPVEQVWVVSQQRLCRHASAAAGRSPRQNRVECDLRMGRTADCQARSVDGVQDPGPQQRHDGRAPGGRKHQLPEGVEQRGTEPAAAGDGRVLTWNMGTLEAGQMREIKLQLASQQRGALNCLATVTFVNASVMQVQVREPLLTLKVKGPDRVVSGDEAAFLITLSNPGDGLTDNIRVKATLPDGLEHPKGRSLEMAVQPLAPRESRTMQAGVRGSWVRPVGRQGHCHGRDQSHLQRRGPGRHSTAQAGPGRVRSQAALHRSPRDLHAQGEQSRQRAGRERDVDRNDSDRVQGAPGFRFGS